MAARKKTAKKKPAKSKTSAGRKTTAKKLAKRKPAARSKAPRRKASARKAAAAKKPAAKKAASTSRKPVQRANQSANRAFPTEKPSTLWGRQSGDLQGVSGSGEADSETVDELLEEGNAFEADAISGVEEAGDKPERPVRTRQVPEDDVPDEYLENE
jgi:hypothetical protein